MQLKIKNLLKMKHKKRNLLKFSHIKREKEKNTFALGNQ